MNQVLKTPTHRSSQRVFRYLKATKSHVLTFKEVLVEYRLGKRNVIFSRDMNLDSDDSFDELIAEGCKARELLLSSKKTSKLLPEKSLQLSSDEELELFGGDISSTDELFSAIGKPNRLLLMAKRMMVTVLV
ncbi:hypothetical protein EB796_002827 [Bugula neritina]|uniref:Uncharacterized protein n=1 Tax=Bugula neritina TaxID=10212 RepID=A0A7J7KKP4_BUGNE|nr:hypothetical protein EB796_002827 [Bugula neritina]